MTHAATNDYVTVEIVGGPPATTATVVVGGLSHGIRLDACGSGSGRVPASAADTSVEITIEDRVVLAGRVPAAPTTAGSP